MKSLDVIFRPKSVAVIGASTKKGSLGREIFDKLLGADFNGPVYPINPKANFIHAVKAYPTIVAVPDKVDLAIIVVPKEYVLDIVKECAESGVKGVVVITAGFRETGEKGAAVENQILEIIKTNNMRLIGPNCMGVINTEDSVRLDATFAPTVPSFGNIAMVSQSGALGQTILEHAVDLNLGVSMFASIGNKPDVSGNDLLEYWLDEPNIEVILMYLESFGDSQQFIQLAKAVSLKKPIIIVKSGRTHSGAKAATSHTGALAGIDVAYDALFKQCGIIRADTINEMFDFAMGFANVPLPKGRRVAIITNAGGPGIMAADACETNGLIVTELNARTKTNLKKHLVEDASVNNPVDLLAGAQPAEFQHALNQVLVDENVDAVIVIFVAPIITNPIQVALKIAEVAQAFDKPVLGCFMGVKGVATGIAELQRQRIPAFPFPESAAKTLSAMANYSEWLKNKQGRFCEFAANKSDAREIIDAAISQNREYLSDVESREILNCYNIPFVVSKGCRDLTEILNAAKEMPRRASGLALKVSSTEIIHKSESGGVKLNLFTDADLESAYAEIIKMSITKGINKKSIAFTLQEMVQHGREVIFGINKINQLGALIMFGLGGVFVEVLHDVAFRIAPLTNVDADQMIKEIKGYPILCGVRGEQAINFEFVKDTILRLSQIAIDLPEIMELDLNPVMLFPQAEKSKAVDIRIRLDKKKAVN